MSRDRKNLLTALAAAAAVALLFGGGIAVILEAGRLGSVILFLPGKILLPEVVDLLSLFQVIVVDAVNRVAGEMEIGGHRMKFGPGIPPVCGTVPALQFVAEHEQVGDWLPVMQAKRFACVQQRSDREFE